MRKAEDKIEEDTHRTKWAEDDTALIDTSFSGATGRYIVQCGLATLCVLVVLLVLDPLRRGASIASLGASSFIAFAMPHQRISRPRLMVGGYAIGIVVGVLCYWLAGLPIWENVAYVGTSRYAVFGAVAVGAAIFLMVVTQSEHPPAAGLALGFVTDGTDARTVLVVALGIVALSTLKTLLKPALRNLT